MDHGHGWAVCLRGHAAEIEIRLFEVVGPLLPAAARRAGGRAASCRRMNRQRSRHATCDEPSQRIEKGMDEIVIMLALNPLMAALTLSLARLSRES